ncbi:MAG: hypothetical protein JWO00_632 [Candidatus Parcubacteria bacterium]|nr:hypothetical protein [Candidatus Parcubacteria bacterium]
MFLNDLVDHLLKHPTALVFVAMIFCLVCWLMARNPCPHIHVSSIERDGSMYVCEDCDQQISAEDLKKVG